MVNVKILGISCSARHANTDIAVKWALESAAELPGVETDFISLAGKTIYPCDSCYRCIDAETDDPCPGKHDDFKEICLKMIEPDGFIMGCMVDFQQASTLFHCLKGRLMCLEFSKLGPEALRTKAFGAIAIGAVPYGGQTTALEQMVMWAHQSDMYVVGCGPEVGKVCGGYLGASGATCQNVACARMFRERGPVSPNSPEGKELIKEDECCKLQSEELGKRVTETAKIIKAGYEAVSRDEIQWPKGKILAGGYTYNTE